MYNPLKIVGKTVVLEEIQPKYFADVIRWRNNKELNQFLNQPFELTMELQEKWFEQYVKDDTQGLLIMIDKKTQEPFGTIGWTDLDLEKQVCIGGRILVGNSEYKGSIQFVEAIIVSSDYLYNDKCIEKMYIHVVKENKKAKRLNRKLGFVENRDHCKYPNELFVNGLYQIEFSRTRELYLTAKKRIMQELRLLI